MEKNLKHARIKWQLAQCRSTEASRVSYPITVRKYEDVKLLGTHKCLLSSNTLSPLRIAVLPKTPSSFPPTNPALEDGLLYTVAQCRHRL